MGHLFPLTRESFYAAVTSLFENDPVEMSVAFTMTGMCKKQLPHQLFAWGEFGSHLAHGKNSTPPELLPWSTGREHENHSHEVALLVSVREEERRDGSGEFVLLELPRRFRLGALLLEDERQARLVHQPVRSRDGQLRAA